jgi:hypothetical protein
MKRTSHITHHKHDYTGGSYLVSPDSSQSVVQLNVGGSEGQDTGQQHLKCDMLIPWPPWDHPGKALCPAWCIEHILRGPHATYLVPVDVATYEASTAWTFGTSTSTNVV